MLGYNGFKMSEWKGEKLNIFLKKYEELDQIKKHLIIDVRNKPEWIETGVFQNAFCVALPSLKVRMNETIDHIIKHKDHLIVIHCKTGMRARLASSILANHELQYNF